MIRTKEKHSPKKDGNTSYWLYLHPYVHISVKKNRAVLYNTLNSKLIEYHDNPEVLKLIKGLNSSNNLYMMRLHQKHITENISRFIYLIKRDFIGDLVDTSYSSGKPVQFKPSLCLQKGGDIFLTVSDKDRIRVLEKDNLKDYLESINLYVNGRCKRNCRICKEAFKQFPFCFKTSKEKELSTADIKGLLEETKGSKLHKLNILGGNIFKHSEYFQFVDLLNRNNNLKKEYFAHYLNIPGANEKEYLEALNDNHSMSVLNILIDFPLQENVLKDVLTFVEGANVNYACKFVVECEKDVEVSRRAISENNIERFGFSPFFNGNNSAFFRRNVFVDKSDILQSSPSMNDIFVRTTLNRYSFGNITIFSDKIIYANVNNPKLGKLGEDDLFTTIAKELRFGRSWAKIRKNVSPCKSCEFNGLCPPITNYEYIIGYYNLCNIRKCSDA